MIDKPPAFETNLEKAPRLEEIVECFEKITGGREYIDVTYENDARGLLTWDIRVTTPDGNGDFMECCYKRGRTIGDRSIALQKRFLLVCTRPIATPTVYHQALDRNLISSTVSGLRLSRLSLGPA